MRIRSNLGVVPKTTEFDHGPFNEYKVYPSGSGIDKWYLGYSRMEQIEDVSSKTRECKVCLHDVADASRVDATGLEFAWYNYGGYGGEHFIVSLGGFHVIPTQKPSLVTVPWSDMASALSEKLAGRIRSKSLLAVTIRELPSTVGMFRNPYNLLNHNWRKLAGLRKSASALAKSGANVWLETQYGWNALNYDLSNFAKSYGRLCSIANLEHQKESENGLISFDENRTIEGGAPFVDRLVGNNYRWGRIDLVSQGCATQAKLFCRARRARAELGRIDYVLNSLGLDNKALMASLWEVVPFSFVVDWFVKLPSMTAPIDYANLRHQSVDLGHSFKSNWVFHAEWYPGILDSYWATGRYDYVCTVPIVGKPGYVSHFERHPGLPDVEGVSLSGELSTCQLASLGALIVQQLTSGKR